MLDQARWKQSVLIAVNVAEMKDFFFFDRLRYFAKRNETKRNEMVLCEMVLCETVTIAPNISANAPKFFALATKSKNARMLHHTLSRVPRIWDKFLR